MTDTIVCTEADRERWMLQARIDELLNVGLELHKREGESPVVWQIADEMDERRNALQAQLNKVKDGK